MRTTSFPFGSYVVVIAGLIGVLVPGCTRYTPRPLDTAAIQTQLQRVSLADLLPAAEQLPASSPSLDLEKGLDADGVAFAALVLNPSLKAKRLEKGIAAGQLIQAGLWPNPELEGHSSWQVDGKGQAIEAALAFEVLRWSERKGEREAAKANVQAVHFEILAEEWKAVSDARLAYWNVIEFEQKLRITLEALSFAERLSQTTRKRAAAGNATELDQNLAELDFAKLRFELLQAETELSLAKAQLGQAIGVPSGTEIKLLRARSFYASFPHAWKQEALADAVRGSAPLKSAEWKYAVAEGELRAAIARQYPSLKLGPKGLFDYDGSWTSLLGSIFAIDLPLLHGNQGEIQAKLAAREQARAEYAARLFERQSELAIAIQRTQRLEIQMGLWTQKLIPQIEDSMRLTEQMYRAGNIDIQTLLRAQASVIESKQKYADLLVDYSRAVQAIEAALGRRLDPSQDWAQSAPSEPEPSATEKSGSF